MAVRSQVDADAAAVQAFGGGTQLQQSLDVLSMQLCCLHHVCQPDLHPTFNLKDSTDWLLDSVH